jgi:hypothetical protein
MALQVAAAQVTEIRFKALVAPGLQVKVILAAQGHQVSILVGPEAAAQELLALMALAPWAVMVVRVLRQIFPAPVPLILAEVAVDQDRLPLLQVAQVEEAREQVLPLILLPEPQILVVEAAVVDSTQQVIWGQTAAPV